MLHCSTYIYRVVLTYKTCQNIFFFLPRKLTFLYSGIFWEMHVLLFHRYQGDVIVWKWRTYSKHIKWKQHLSCSVISYQVLTHTKRGPSDPARSPEFLFKTSNLYVSIKNWSCSGEPLVGSFFGARALFWANLNTIHPLGDIRDQDLVVLNQEILYVSIYKSM